MSTDIAQLRQQVSDLKLELQDTYSEIYRLEGILMRTLGVIGRSCGTRDILDAMVVIRRAIMLVRLLHMAITMLTTARMAGGDPLAWLSFGVQVTSLGASMALDVEASCR